MRDKGPLLPKVGIDAPDSGARILNPTHVSSISSSLVTDTNVLSVNHSAISTFTSIGKPHIHTSSAQSDRQPQDRRRHSFHPLTCNPHSATTTAFRAERIRTLHLSRELSQLATLSVRLLSFASLATISSNTRRVRLPSFATSFPAPLRELHHLPTSSHYSLASSMCSSS